MTTERFEEICEQLDPSMASVLNLIRQYVQANQASVMVGAGFSKNADMNPGVEMKDWNELGVEFYKRLYAVSNPEKKDFYFKSPIRLASQFASLTTRAELDNVISNSLPNNSIKPGALHKMLMKLPWKDVFTTNYDTLLERTNQDWIQHYEVVTNRETLIYSKSPRIIKLHGSFPDQRPFIITEEDFRTYPKLHPEFVNTVRQSLIENLFCLLGFSGDDENFLSWIGWLRDVIGKDSVLCYMITYNRNMHDSEASLLEDRGITPVNLYRLPLNDSEGYADALEFFLTYVAPKEEKEDTSWSGFIGFDPYSNLKEATKTMAQVRESYPGWPFLPAELLSDFEDIERRAPFIGEKFEALDEKHKKAFAKEFLWRMQISYSPLKFSWLYAYLESQIEHVDIWDTEKADIALVLLTAYRIEGNFDKFRVLFDRMDGIEEWGASSQIHKYIYEAALSYMSMINMQALKGLAANWEVRAEDTMPSLWKANILAYLGDLDGAVVLLEAAKQYLETQFRTTSSVTNRMYMDVLRTSLAALDSRGNVSSSYSKSLYLSYVDKLKNDLAEYEKIGRPGQRIEHTYNIGRKILSKRSGVSGLFGDYIYPMRYITMRERIGYPMGANDHGIDPIPLQLFLTPLIKYEPAYATGCVFRSINSEVAKSVFSRELLHSWGRDECAEMFKEDSTLRNVFESPKNSTEECIRKRVLIPLFSRMCIRFEQDNVNKVFDVVISEARKYPKHYNLYQDELSIIYDCANEESKARMLLECLKSPLPEKMTLSDILMPTCITDDIKIPEWTIIMLTKALQDESLNTHHVVQRLLGIWKYLSESQKAIVQGAFVTLRKKKWNYLVVSTFEKIPPVDDEKSDVRVLCEHIISSFVKTSWVQGESSSNNEYIVGLIEQLIHLRDNISPKQWVEVYRHLCHLIPEVYKADDGNGKNDIFGVGAYYYSRFNLQLRRLAHLTVSEIMDSPIRRDLLGLISFIDSEEIPLMEIKALLMEPEEYLDDIETVNLLKSRLMSMQNNVRDDGFAALQVMMPHNMVYYNSMISSLIPFATKTNEEVLIQYLQRCRDLVLIPNNNRLANRLAMLLIEVLKMVRKNEMPNEVRTDIIYYAGVLAGVMRCVDIRRKDVIDDWIAYLIEEETDTDVRLSLIKGDRLYTKKIHKNNDNKRV